MKLLATRFLFKVQHKIGQRILPHFCIALFMSLNIIANNTYAENEEEGLQDLGVFTDSLARENPEYRSFGKAVTYKNYMYIPVRSNSLKNPIDIYNISDPENPVFVKSIEPYNNEAARSLWVCGDKLITAYPSLFDLVVYSLSDPENPQMQSVYDEENFEQLAQVAEHNGFFYLLNFNYNSKGKLEIFDVRNGYSADLKQDSVSSFSPGSHEGRCFAFSEDGNSIFVAYRDMDGQAPWGNFVVKLDISDPANPVQKEMFDIENQPAKMEMIGDTLILLTTGVYQGPSKIHAYYVGGDGFVPLCDENVSTSQAIDMHIVDRHITLALGTEGIKTYTWDGANREFVAGESFSGIKAGSISCSYHQPQDQLKSAEQGQATAVGVAAITCDVFYMVMLNYLQDVYSFEPWTALGHNRFKQRLKLKIDSTQIVDTTSAKQFTLTMKIEPEQAASDGCKTIPTGTTKHNEGEKVQISYTMPTNSPWAFYTWKGIGTGATTITMDADKEATAVFCPYLDIKAIQSCEEVLLPEDALKNYLYVGHIKLEASGADSWTVGSFELNTRLDEGVSAIMLKSPGDNSEILAQIPVEEEKRTYRFNLNKTIEIGKGETCYINVFFIFNSAEVTDLSQTKVLNPMFEIGEIRVDVDATPGTSEYGEINWVKEKVDFKIARVKNITQQQGFVTINEAIEDNTTKSGDIIAIGKDEYNEQVKIKNKSIELHGKGGNSVLKGSGNIVEVTVPDVTIKNIKFCPGDTETNAIYVEGFAARNLNVEENIFDAGLEHAIQINKGTGCSVSNNKFQDLTKSSIMVFDSEKITISDNQYSNGTVADANPNFVTISNSINSDITGNKGEVLNINVFNNSENITVANNQATDSLYIYTSMNNGTISENSCEQLRINISESKQVKISKHSNKEGLSNVYIEKSSDVTFSENVFNLKSSFLEVVESEQVKIEEKNEVYEVNITLSSDVDITDNRLVEINIEETCSNTNISKNKIAYFEEDIISSAHIDIKNSINPTQPIKIFDNEMRFCEELLCGLTIDSCSNIFLESNTITLKEQGDVDISSSKNIVVRNNTINCFTVGKWVDINLSEDFVVEGNKICSNIHNVIDADKDGKTIGLYVGSCSDFTIHKNTVRYSTDRGMLFSNVKNSTISNNKVCNNCGTGMKFDVMLFSRVINNYLRYNCTGIYTKKNFYVWFYGNDVQQSFCDQTGIKLDSSNLIISHNRIANNSGDAIFLANNSSPTIVANQIYGNQMAGVNNGNLSGSINASGNYWGTPDGPTENDINGDVTVNAWLDTISPVIGAFFYDTMKIEPMQADSNILVLRNFDNPYETFNVSVVEGQEYITGDTIFTGLKGDTLGVMLPVNVEIPTQQKDIMIKVRTGIESDPLYSRADSFYVNALKKYAVTINVANGQNPIANAVLEVGGKEYLSGQGGQIIIEGLPDGVYPFLLQADNYTPLNSTFEIKGEDLTLDLNLIATATWDIVESNIEIFPNPAGNFLFVRNAAGQRLVIYNLNGTVVKNTVLNSGDESLNVHNLPNGFYIVSVGNHREPIVVRR